MQSLQGAQKMKNKQSVFLLHLLILSVVGITLSGCVNLKPKADPVKMYALGPVDSSASVSGQGPSIYVERPNMPAYLDGKRLQYRTASGEVEALKYARWAEPLEEGIARCIAEHLIQSSGQHVAGFYPWPDRSKESLDLYVQFYKLGAFENGEVRMAATWELKLGSKTQRAGTFQAQGVTWERDNAESLVTAINSSLAQLAEAVVGAN